MSRPPPHETQSAKDSLRAHGLRATPARLDVLAALGRCRAPVTAQELTRRLRSRDADRVTVYRTLNTFVDSGLAHRLDPGDRIFRFALAGPLASSVNGEHASHDAAHGHTHPHLVCDSCGTVECVDDAEVIVHRRIAPARSRAASFKVKQQDVILHGTCGECGQDESTAAASKPPRRARP